ncbi:hypothetical protein ONZ45_g544 [Pleurotus djamor]|nr:hypothetical protein ONZ45_g544 [Pleurotus djamor]
MNTQSGLDSITLGQLRAMVGTGPKPKKTRYDFRYDDEDMVMNELDEFYSYVEMPQAGENLRAWEGSFDGEWTRSDAKKRTSYVEVLLECLEHRDPVVRFTNARRLFYILQGTFVETTSAEHQLHWIIENAKLVRSLNGVSVILEALKIASAKYDLLCGLSDSEADRLHISGDERSDFMEELTTEIHVYLGLLYHIVEVLKGNEDFADELMSLEPPLPVYLFNVLAVTKLLLLLWKSLLACCGGIRELARVKALTRELNGLPSGPLEELPIKSSPMDIETFRHETTVKYPTFAPPQQAPQVLSPTPLPAAPPPSKLAQAYAPIPIRHHYHNDESESPLSAQQSSAQSAFQYQHPNNQYRPTPQPATPAPSPPPTSPKPKKQQFHTDPNRPFLFPFSRSQMGRDGRLVPFAIDEADKLYNKHLYISLSLLQMWQTREDCMMAESGLDHLPGHEGRPSTTYSSTDDTDNAEPLPDVALIDDHLSKASTALREAKTNVDKQAAKERSEDLVRLKRVEQIYSATLSTTSSWVQVIMKLLLATVSASLSTQPPQSTTSAMFPPGVASPAQEQPPPPPQTLEEIDITRHREITSKAVSAILLLTLKWFKVSHAMKQHFLGQHLLEFNCLLILLKMFSIQEVTNTVVHKADSPEHKNAQHNTVDPYPTRPSLPKNMNDDVELLTDFSWRNLFTAINFAKIMQKLSKHRSHRIWMLSQHKSSAVLKRITRVSHPILQLQALKLIKSQVPYCGRKWRTSNMKVITQIYLNCRPELRDEWLTGVEPEDQNEAQAQEQALRHLVKFYNSRRYGSSGAASHSSMHRRTGSVSHQIEGFHPGDMSSFIRPAGTPNVVDSDVFPPPRSHAPSSSIFLPYITEDIAFEEEYEEYLSDLGWSDEESDRALFGGTSAWHRLPAFASEIADGISDSESIVSIGDLGDDARLDLSRDEREVDENINNWEHMSPKTMAALPKSPAGRRSSSGGGLRPIVPFRLNDGSAVDLDDEDDEPELGPAPRESDGPFASGGGVDEVEYAYGMLTAIVVFDRSAVFKTSSINTHNAKPPPSTNIIDTNECYNIVNRVVVNASQNINAILLSPDEAGPIRHRPNIQNFISLDSPSIMAAQPQPQSLAQMLPEGQDLNGDYYQEPNDLTGGLPINLDSLRDGPPGTKPFYPYSTLIRYAIKGSPNQKLLLEDIYYAIESRNSVRHNLSLNPCFEKVPRPLTDRGKGSYWVVNDNVDPRTGVHRIRKKKTKSSKRASEEAEYLPQDNFDDPTVQFVAAPPMDSDDAAGPSRQPPPVVYPPTFPPPPFDPAFMMHSMRFGIPGMPIPAEEGLEMDEHGNVNWRAAWIKEIGHLQALTSEQEKAGADQEWYRLMLLRVRTALMPPMNPETMMQLANAHGMTIPNGVDPQQQLQQQQQATQPQPQ